MKLLKNEYNSIINSIRYTGRVKHINYQYNHPIVLTDQQNVDPG